MKYILLSIFALLSNLAISQSDKCQQYAIAYMMLEKSSMIYSVDTASNEPMKFDLKGKTLAHFFNWMADQGYVYVDEITYPVGAIQGLPRNALVFTRQRNCPN